MNESSDDRKGLRQTFPENCNITNGLCQSLKMVADYRLRILNKIKEQLRSATMWKKSKCQ